MSKSIHRWAILVLASMVVCQPTAQAAAAEDETSGALLAASTPVRVGNHPGFGRVVFDLPPGATYEVVTERARVVLVFQGAGLVREPSSVPRYVKAISTGLDRATIDMQAGARARTTRLGERLVIDVLYAAPVPASGARPVPPQAAGARPAVPATQPPMAPATAAIELPTAPMPVPAEPANEAKTKEPEQAAAPTIPVQRQDLIPVPANGPEPGLTHDLKPTVPDPGIVETRAAFVVKADLDVGAAAFRRGGRGVVIFDRRLAPQPVPAGVDWLNGAINTAVTMPVSVDAELDLTRTAAGWSIAARPANAGDGMQAAMATSAGPEGLALPLPRPGRVVTVLDPLAGGTLLVGTSLAGGSDAAVRSDRRTPDYALLRTWLGVVVEASADRVDLRVGQNGFTLVGAPPPPTATLSAQSRRFEMPNEPARAIMNRMQAQLTSAASAPPRARARERLAAAQSMLALGLGPEAQALIQVASAEDPQAAADAQTVALAAVAAMMSGRTADAAGLDDPRLTGTDEIGMWRGLRDRRLNRDTPAARDLGRYSPLAWSYPEGARRTVWPDVSEAAIQSGADIPGDRLPPYVRALTLERAGQVDAALAAYDAVAAGSDRLAQVRATAAAAELRLSAGRITPPEAAAIMERQSFAWRGDAREAGFRMRSAELQSAAGQWRSALDELRSVEANFPELKADVLRRKGAVMQAVLAVDAGKLAAVDVVLLASEYADCIPDGAAGAAFARLLASKLAALDLPARAIPVLQGLMRAAPAGEARAEFGGRLAQMLLDGGDRGEALAALEASAAADLPPSLQESRALTAARLRAANGDLAGAIAGLADLKTARADDLRAVLLSDAGDWRGAALALSDLVARTVPSEGKLPELGQELLLRQASAAAQAGDVAMLRNLARSADRIEGTRGEMFRLLTAAPVAVAGDLPRSSRELAALRGFPQRLLASGPR